MLLFCLVNNSIAATGISGATPIAAFTASGNLTGSAVSKIYPFA